MKLRTIATLVFIAALAGCKQPKLPDHDGHAGMGMSGPMNHKMQMLPMPAAYAGDADKAGAPRFDGLGAHTHPISTKNAGTQALFSQGVNLLFGFNHAEAIRSFREAARLDADCAICWWGVAFALGPNINLPMQPDAVAPAWDALGRAQALKDKASPVEREWIDALAARYVQDPAADRKPLDAAFADAMGRLWKAHPDDFDAGTFYAEAMMDTQAWDYWEADGKTPKGRAADVMAVLEDIMKRAPDHPGALHLYIHAAEASITPERAEAAADRLLPLMPSSGHMVHMPSHIYYRVGRYADAVRVNEEAAKVDEAYIAACKAQGYYPKGYYAHNIHLLWTASEMMGRYQASIDAARRLVKASDANVLAETMPAGELYAFAPIATLVRFGKWDEVLAESLPSDKLLIDMSIWHYARGFAQVAKGDIAAAKASRTQADAITKKDFAPYVAAGLPGEAMAKLSLKLLDGEIARAEGNLVAAITAFREAAAMEAALPYMEPPFWHRPTPHLLGAALLQAKKPAEAEQVYRDSLKSYRLDGWALFGLAQALDAQGKRGAAQEVRQQLAQVWSLADVQLASSRF